MIVVHLDVDLITVQALQRFGVEKSLWWDLAFWRGTEHPNPPQPFDNSG